MNPEAPIDILPVHGIATKTLYPSTRLCMNRFLLVCIILVAACLPAPASAFIDRNDVTSAAQFRDYVPASYLKSAGITDNMTVYTALDKYITYALIFSSPTAYAYIAQLSNPAQVKIRAGGSMADASRGDVVSEGWNIEVGDGALLAIRYPGGVMHTITGPYTYTMPAYGEWGKSAKFGPEYGGPVDSHKTPIVLPDTTGYKIVTNEIPCRGLTNSAVQLAKVTGTVYAVHYSQNPTNPKYFSIQLPAGKAASLSDTTTLVVGPGSSATIDDLDLTVLSEKTVYRLEPRSSECVMDTNWAGKPTGIWREKTIVDSIKLGIIDLFYRAQAKVFEITNPTVVAGVRG